MLEFYSVVFVATEEPDNPNTVEEPSLSNTTSEEPVEATVS